MRANNPFISTGTLPVTRSSVSVSSSETGAYGPWRNLFSAEYGARLRICCVVQATARSANSVAFIESVLLEGIGGFAAPMLEERNASSGECVQYTHTYSQMW